MFSPVGALPSQRDDLLYLLSDREHALESLLRTLERDPDDGRRVHAVQTMRAILRQPGPFALRRRCLDRAVDLATGAGPSSAVEAELAGAIADWAPSTGLDTRQRSAILARAKTAPPSLLPAWASVLAEIGGREETLLLISLGDTHEAALLNAILSSSLVRSCWPGLLPALKGWLDDPEIAPRALRYSLLRMTPEGRDILLAYATSVAHPVELRRQAIESLQDTIPGANLLLKAIERSDTAAVLGAALESDPRVMFRAALAKLEARNGEALWSELIDGVETGYPNQFPNPTTALEKAASDAEARMREHTSESSLRCLGWITGRTDLRSRAEWRRWYETTRPSPLSQCEVVKLALDHPEALLDTAAILRRIVPYHLAAVPAECIPLYERMVREGTPTSRYWACSALLLCSPETDAVPMTIDLIGPPGDVAGGWGPVELLKYRFAENFFWDTTAWREWWAKRRRSP
jgi:hypothetical protein